MISKFSVANYYSFDEKVTLSFNHKVNRAHSFNQNKIYEYSDNGKRAILNGGIIVGANASGKSNLIKGLIEFTNFIKYSSQYESVENFIYDWDVFKFNEDENNITEFSIELILLKEIYQQLNDDILINYEFHFDTKENKVTFEDLSYKKIMKTKVSESFNLFSRKNDEIINNPKSLNRIIDRIQVENIDMKLVSSILLYDINKSYFANEINTLEYSIIEAFMNYIVMKIKDSNNQVSKRFYEEIENNEEYKSYIIDNLYDFDFAIKDFVVEDITDDLIASFNSSGIEGRFIEKLKKERSYRAITIHEINEKKKELDYGSESMGTQKFLAHSLVMYETLRYSGLYVCDEFESHYHQKLQTGIINNFINQDKYAQFIIVSHNAYLLNKQLFAKEQIIFVEKNRTNEKSFIYSLNDFDVSYTNHNWTNLYLEGRFGAIPEVIY